MANPPLGADPFNGLSKRWAQLMQWVSAATGLPDSLDKFTARYGKFEDQAEVTRFVDAISGIKELAEEAGGPSALKRELLSNPSVLQDATPPGSLFGRLLWFAGQVLSAAQTAEATLQGIDKLLTRPGESAESRARALKAVLAGPGGLVETFSRTRGLAEDFAAALDASGEKVTELSGNLAKTQLINQANIAIGELKSANKHLLAEQDKKASFSERGRAPSGADQIAANNAEIARKQALIDDTAALLAANDRVGAVFPGIRAAVEGVALQFQRAANQLIQFTAISSPEQLGDAAWVNQALAIPTLIAGWHTLAEAAQSFSQHGPECSESSS